MVKQLRQWVGVFAGLLVFGGGSAKADGVLEKMQAEVADLTEKMRGAVVTIQDEQGVLQSSEVFFFNDPLGDAKGRIFKVEAEWKSLSERRATLERKIRSAKALPKSEANSTTLESLLRRHVELLQQMDSLKTDKALSSTHLKALQRDLFVEQLRGKAKSDDRAQEQVPVLSDLPIAGNLFQKHVLTQEKVPVLGDLPIAGNLFHKQALDSQKNVKQIKIFVSRTGSGFSIGDGYIVTTGDVALSLRQPIVITDNGTRFKARVVGSHPDLNIGLLRIIATTSVPSLKLGDSNTVRAGHFAVSMGNQAGQNNSVALMLVGNVRNEGTYAGRQFYPSLIQIAGTVGAGASGAPLVNVKGEVIGMMAAIPVENGNWNSDALVQNWGKDAPSSEQGGKLQYRPAPDNNLLAFMNSSPTVTSAGFAIPINQIKPIIDELRLEKPISRGWIGIAPEDVSRIVEKANGIIDTEVTVRVVGVYPESPAMAAGVQPGDVLITVDGKPVRNASTIRQTSLRIRRGDTVTLTLRRGKDTKALNLKIEARPLVIKAPITVPIKETF